MSAWKALWHFGPDIKSFFRIIGASTIKYGFSAGYIPGNKADGTPIWFTIHRFGMATSFFLTIGGFIGIFIILGGWSSSAGLHGILGCVVVGLTLINFILGVTRPDKGMAYKKCVFLLCPIRSIKYSAKNDFFSWPKMIFFSWPKMISFCGQKWFLFAKNDFFFFGHKWFLFLPKIFFSVKNIFYAKMIFSDKNIFHAKNVFS